MSPNRKRSRSFAEPAPYIAGETDAFTQFRARMRAGDYNALVGRKLQRSLRDAAANPGLDDEIGALRIALIRLLKEEPDPSRLATGIARLGAVAVQAARLRQSPDPERAEIHAHLSRVLAEIDAEQAAARAAAPLPPSISDWDDPEAPFPDAESPSPTAV